MGEEVTLSPDQLEALNNGVTVELGPATVPGRVTINPPCEEAGHNWGRYKIKQDQDGEREIRRRCMNCDERETTAVNLEELFNQ